MFAESYPERGIKDEPFRINWEDILLLQIVALFSRASYIIRFGLTFSLERYVFSDSIFSSRGMYIAYQNSKVCANSQYSLMLSLQQLGVVTSILPGRTFKV